MANAKVTKEIFLGNNRIMTWLVVGDGSRTANIPKDILGNTPKNDGNRFRNEIADLMPKHPEEVKAARARINEERRKANTDQKGTPAPQETRELASV